MLLATPNMEQRTQGIGISTDKSPVICALITPTPTTANSKNTVYLYRRRCFLPRDGPVKETFDSLAMLEFALDNMPEPHC